MLIKPAVNLGVHFQVHFPDLHMHRRLANRRRPLESCAKFSFSHVTALCLQINLSTLIVD